MTKNLTAELQEEHRFLAEALTKVKALGPSEEGLKLLNSSKAALLAHLKKEDTFLYPELRKIATTDQRVGGIVDMFASDMAKISQAAIEFFQHWENGGDPEDFAKELDTLISVLLGRIRREEMILYPEYKLAEEKNVA